MYNDKSLEGLLPCDLFSKEDYCDEEEDEYSLEHDTSDEDSLTFDKEVDEDFWTFMENPIYDMSEEENNEPKTFDGFIDNPVYVISNRGSFESLDGLIEDPIYEVFKEESMDLVALGNFYMEERHAVYTYDQSEPYISTRNEDLEKQCSE